MAQLKGNSLITGECTVSGKVYAKGDSTDLSTKIINNSAKIRAMLGTGYSLSTAITLYNSTTNNATPSALLTGNSLRLYFYITLGSSVSGNVSNTKFAMLTVTHNNKISGIYNMPFNDYGWGGQISMYTSNLTLNDTTMTADLYITASANSTTSINSYFVLPCIVDIAYF